MLEPLFLGINSNASQLSESLLTASFTIFGGMLTYVTGQVASKFFIEPLHAQRAEIGLVQDSLIYYGDIYGNPGVGKEEDMAEASNTFRKHASQLTAKTQTVPWYDLWPLLGIARSRRDILKARQYLVMLSNSVFRGDAERNIMIAKKIRQCLGIEVEDEDRYTSGETQRRRALVRQPFFARILHTLLIVPIRAILH